MTYTEISNLLKELHAKDLTAFIKIDIVKAVEENINLDGYSEEDYEELCRKIDAFWLWNDCDFNIDCFAYALQELLDEGDYDEFNEECFDDARRRAKQIVEERN